MWQREHINRLVENLVNFLTSALVCDLPLSCLCSHDSFSPTVNVGNEGWISRPLVFVGLTLVMLVIHR